MYKGGTDWIYFVQASYSSLIKIGKTHDIDGRLRHLGHMSAVPIFLLAKLRGETPEEKYFHNIFAAYRDHGEWFGPHESILQTVNRIKAVAVEGFCGECERSTPFRFQWIDEMDRRCIEEMIAHHVERFNALAGPNERGTDVSYRYHRSRAIGYATVLKNRFSVSTTLTFDPILRTYKATESDADAVKGTWFGHERLIRNEIGTPAETLVIA